MACNQQAHQDPTPVSGKEAPACSLVTRALVCEWTLGPVSRGRNWPPRPWVTSPPWLVMGTLPAAALSLLSSDTPHFPLVAMMQPPPTRMTQN